MIEEILKFIIEHTQWIRFIIGDYDEWGTYGIILIIVTLEFFVLLLLSISNIIIGVYRDFNTRTQGRQRGYIHGRIHKYLYNNDPIPTPFFENRRLDLFNIVPLLDQLDTQMTSSRWDEIKSIICQSRYRPIARRWIKSPSWQKQNMGLRFLNFSPTLEDEALYLYAIEMPLPLLKMQAVEGLVKLKSEVGIHRVLRVAAKERGYTGFAYIDELIQSDLDVYKIVFNYYQESSDPEIRLICLKVLQNKVSFDFLAEIEKDLNSPHLELAETAVSSMGQIINPRSLALLKQLVDHPEPRIRTQAVINLGKLSDPQSIPHLLKAQCDSSYPVRLNACIAMLKLGERGRKALMTIDEDLDRYASQTAKYVLSFDLEAR